MIIGLVVFSIISSTLSYRKTPKASQLQNHFGYSSMSSPYGNEVQEKPNIHMMTEEGLISGHNLPNPQTSFVASASCDIALQPYYSICHDINDCEVCSSTNKCGWCASSAKCLPGSVYGCSCPSECSSHWLYSSLSECHNGLASGELTNIAPESKKLIKPQEPYKIIEETLINPITVQEITFLPQQNRNLNQVKVDNSKGYMISNKVTLSNGNFFSPNEIKKHGAD